MYKAMLREGFKGFLFWRVELLLFWGRVPEVPLERGGSLFWVG